MNKIICVLLCVALCLSLLACGKKAEKDMTDPAATKAADNTEAVPQQTNEAGEVITPTGTDAQQGTETTQAQQENTSAAAGQSSTQATLPPEVDVSMGVVEGEDDGGIEEDFGGTPSTQPPATTPSTQPSGESQIDESFDITTLTYEGYNAMSGEDQKKVIDMFGSTDDFMRWYKAVEAQYKQAHPDVEIGGDGSIDAGDLAG